MQNVKYSLVWLTPIAIYLFLVFINAVFPTQSDDINASFGGLQGAYSSYMNWNGRLGELFRVTFAGALAHTPFYAPINAFFGTALLYLTFILIFARIPFEKYTKKNGTNYAFDAGILCFIATFLMLFYGGFGSVFVWAAGALNYLWVYVIILSFLIPFRFFIVNAFLDSQKTKISESKEILKAVGMLFLGLCAGWSSELGIMLFVTLALLGAFLIFKGHKLPLWFYTGLLGFIVGWLILFNSPGSNSRAELLKKDGDYRDWGLFFKLTLHEQYNIIDEIYRSVRSRFMLAFCLVLAITFSIVCVKTLKNKATQILIALASVILSIILFFVLKQYLLSVLVCVGFYLYVYFYLGRAEGSNTLLDSEKSQNLIKDFRNVVLVFVFLYVLHLGFMFLTLQVGLPARATMHYSLIQASFFVILFSFVAKTIEGGGQYKIFAKTCTIASVCAFIVSAIFVANEFLNMRYKWEQMVGDINAQKTLGLQEVRVSKKYFESSYKNYDCWVNPTDNPNQWPNNEYAKHFGVEKFIVE